MKNFTLLFLFIGLSIPSLSAQTTYYVDFNGVYYSDKPTKFEYEVGDGYKIFFEKSMYGAKDPKGNICIAPQRSDELLYLGCGVFAEVDEKYLIEALNLDLYRDPKCIGFVNGFMKLSDQEYNGQFYGFDSTKRITEKVITLFDNGTTVYCRDYSDREARCSLLDKKTLESKVIKKAYEGFPSSEGLIPVRTGDWKYGYADARTGEMVIPFNKNWSNVGSFFNGYAYIMNKGQVICIDKAGEKQDLPADQCIRYEIIELNGIHIGTKHISETEKVYAIIEPATQKSSGYIYSKYEAIEGYYLMSDEKTIDVYNYRAKQIINDLPINSKCVSNYDILLVNNPDKKEYSVLNRDGKILLSMVDDVKSVYLLKGYLEVTTDKKIFISTVNPDVHYFDFSGKMYNSEPENIEYNAGDGYKIFKKGVLYGAKKSDGTICMPAGHDNLKYLGSHVFFEEDGPKSGWFYNNSGQKLVPDQYNLVYNTFRNGTILLKKDNAKYLMDSTGRMIVDNKEDEPDDYFDFILTENCILDKKTEEKKCYDVDFLATFSDGLIRFKKDHKYGFMDVSGNIVIEPRYDEDGEVTDFINGVAKVYFSNGQEMYIDKKGNPIEPEVPFIRLITTNYGGMTELNIAKEPYVLYSFKNNKTKKETGFVYYFGNPLLLRNPKYYNGNVFVNNKENTAVCMINYQGNEVADELRLNYINIDRKVRGNGNNTLVRMATKKGGPSSTTYAKVFDHEGRELVCIADTFGNIELMDGFLKCFQKTQQDVLDDMKEPEAEEPEETVSSSNTFVVAFVMQKASSSMGSRSVSYACIFVEVSTSQNPSEGQLISAAKNAISSISLNGYRDFQTIVTKGSLNAAKKNINNHYSLSDFRVEYATY